MGSAIPKPSYSAYTNSLRNFWSGAYLAVPARRDWRLVRLRRIVLLVNSSRMFRIPLALFSFPGSAWERDVFEAPPRPLFSSDSLLPLTVYGSLVFRTIAPFLLVSGWIRKNPGTRVSQVPPLGQP